MGIAPMLTHPCSVVRLLWPLCLAGLLLNPFGCDSDDNGSPDGSLQDASDNDGDSQTSDGSDGASDAGSKPDLPICDEVDLKSSPLVNLLLVIDKSASMENPTTSAQPNRSKTEDLRDAVRALVDEFTDRIRFGWLAFPHQEDCDPGVVSVPVADDSAKTISDLLDLFIPWGGTPTGESLQNARAHPGLHDSERTNFVILVTDGMPTCPTGLGHDQNPTDNALALQAVTDLKADGIDTFIIGLGQDLNASNPDLLNQMAVAGGQPRDDAVKYYQANSLEGLSGAFGAIAETIFECELALDVVPEIPAYIWVYFDDQPISRDPVNGFGYDAANNQIQFFGTACEQLRSGQIGRVSVKMGCAPPK